MLFLPLPDAFEEFFAAQIVAMRDFSAFFSAFSTTICVAMPAWSVPGSQRTSLPSMRALRARMSWMVLLRTWPIVSMPVTFGGGMTMEYAGFVDCASATKHFRSSQNWYHLSSTDCGS